MKKIELNGKEFPCRVTMGAMVRFKRESGKDVSQMSQTDISELVLFLWCCVSSACSADGVEFAFTFEQFADCLEPQEITGFCDGVNDGQKKTTVTEM